MALAPEATLALEAALALTAAFALKAAAALEGALVLKQPWPRIEAALALLQDHVIADITLPDTVAITGLEVTHYAGFEDGEYWVEEDRKKTSSFRAPAGGMYKMAVVTEGDKRVNMQATLLHAPRLTRYNCCVGSFGLIFGGLILMLWRGAESARFDTD